MSDIRKFTGKRKPVTSKPKIACSHCTGQLFILTTDSFICNGCHTERPLSQILDVIKQPPKSA